MISESILEQFVKDQLKDREIKYLSLPKERPGSHYVKDIAKFVLLGLLTSIFVFFLDWDKNHDFDGAVVRCIIASILVSIFIVIYKLSSYTREQHSLVVIYDESIIEFTFNSKIKDLDGSELHSGKGFEINDYAFKDMHSLYAMSNKDGSGQLVFAPTKNPKQYIKFHLNDLEKAKAAIPQEYNSGHPRVLYISQDFPKLK